ncbi:mediator of RNA polymerase II transcription subunit 4 [Xylariales sp. AK1849]|nr:mediator of RNA polymerase II transcription subunit 4 [Xylariales sp. AK1849]
MDKYISARFDRVEKALSSLVDSIAKYNPSAYQGTELLAAENELSKGLEDLQVHQQNHARIQSLQSTTTSLDSQIRETLTLLAQTRKELVSTPATIFPNGPNYTIKYDELLAYARRISKTTLPPAGVSNGTPAPAADSQPKPDNATGIETAVTTPVGGTPNGASTPAPGSTPVANGEPASQATIASNNTSLPEHLTAHLNPLANTDFIPWPTEDHVRAGALANIAYLAERGIDPEGYDPAEEEARKKREEEEARAREERERKEREENERRVREQREQVRLQREKENKEKEESGAWRRDSVSQGGPAAGVSVAAGASASASAGAQEKKQFQFMGGDDDDESD